jgi:hypothetical protein
VCPIARDACHLQILHLGPIYDLQDMNPRQGSLLVGKIALDKTWGHGAIPNLPTCCGGGVTFTPQQFDLTTDPVYSDITGIYTDQCTGDQSVYSDIYNWASGNSAIAQVQPFKVRGMSNGKTYVEGESDPVLCGTRHQLRLEE